MRPLNAVRATHRGDDPRKAVQLGCEQHFSSKFSHANQQARDLIVAAVTPLPLAHQHG